MKLKLLSDLHLEVQLHTFIKRAQRVLSEGDMIREWDEVLAGYLDSLAPSSDEDKETVLVLAGDILTTHTVSYMHSLFAKMAAYKAVVYVPGNHEFYTGKFPDGWTAILTAINGREDIHLIAPSGGSDTFCETLDGVQFLGGTLWTSLNNADPNTMDQCSHYMNDYAAIVVGDGSLLCPKDTVDAHFRMREELLRYDRGDAIARVVVTHHAPTRQSIAPRYLARQFEPFNHAFSSDDDSLVHTLDADVWIHGHTHTKFDYTVEGGRTRMLCNPIGYPGENVFHDGAVTLDV